MKRIGVVLVVGGIAAWPAGATADRVTRGTVIQATDVVAGERTIRVVYSVRRTNTLLPPYLVRYELQLPPRSRARTAGFPRCGLATLQAKGPSACPLRSRVGSGSASGRTIFHPGGVSSKLTIFNGQRIGSRPAVLVYVDPSIGPTFVNVGKIYGGKKVRLDFAIPTIKYPEWQPDAVMSDLALRFDTSFLSARCPGTYRLTAHYWDEPFLSSTDRARCD